jgi:2'-5' RNA ligase
MRVFVALPLPDAVAATLASFVQQFDQSRIRWVAQANFHVTLRFLGDIPVDDVKSVSVACARAARVVGPLRLVVEGTGAFPGWHRPSVLWAGLSGETASLRQLATCLEEELVRVGFPPEPRPFKAHVTLGRCRSSCSRELCQRLQAAGEKLREPWLADTMVIYQSVLSRLGPSYVALDCVELGGAPRGGEAERGKQSVH